ncbi:MAG: hypothetical protein KA807_02785 [Prolixibacteraceae bacterium]|nr:hypothetical protein [Prolixibacteraceae bacterium]
MKVILVFIFSLVPLFIAAVNFNIDTLLIKSKILGEEREILIFEPEGLNQKDTVNLIFLLDGEFSKYRYELIADCQNRFPVIGIGIVNTNNENG